MRTVDELIKARGRRSADPGALRSQRPDQRRQGHRRRSHPGLAAGADQAARPRCAGDRRRAPRPAKVAPDPEYSLRPVADRLAQLMGRPVEFALDTIGESARLLASELHDGQLLLLENVRFKPRARQQGRRRSGTRSPSAWRSSPAARTTAARSSRTRSGPCTASTPRCTTWPRCAPSPPVRNARHLANECRSASSLLVSPGLKRTFSSAAADRRAARWPATGRSHRSCRARTRRAGPSAGQRSATGRSEYSGSGAPLGRPRCAATITRAPWSSSLVSTGSEARMRPSSVTLPSLIGTLRSERTRIRRPATRA